MPRASASIINRRMAAEPCQLWSSSWPSIRMDPVVLVIRTASPEKADGPEAGTAAADSAPVAIGPRMSRTG
jgi:hypothetical protein